MFILGLTAAIGILTVAAFTLWSLYAFTIQENRERLTEAVRGQASLIKAVARFDQRHNRDYPMGAREATLSQVRDAMERQPGLGATGEFILGRREKNKIHILLRQSHSGDQTVTSPAPIPFSSDRAVPMRLALSGQSGSIVARDFRGVESLAVFEPLEELDLGLVVKVSMSEIREPFLRIGGGIAVLSLAAVILGAWLFARINERTVRGLLHQDRTFRALVESVRDALIAVDAQGRIRLWNKSAEEVFGYTQQEALGEPLTLLIPPEEQPVHLAGFQRALQNEEPILGGRVVELTGLRRGGERFPIQLSVTRMELDGKVGFASVVRDITGPKETEKRVARLKEDLETNERSRIAEVLHDGIGQSLQSINLSLSLWDAQSQSRQTIDGQALKRAAEEMAGVIEQIRDLSAELKPTVLERMHLDEAMRWWVEKVEERHSLRVTFDGVGDFSDLTPRIKLNLFRGFQEAVTNVIRHAEANRIHIRLRREADRLIRLTVEDNGVGFDPDNLPVEGGVGLALMRERADRLGGDLIIRNGADHGVAVTFEVQA